MKFFSPFWLWGLLLVPFFYGMILLDEKRRQNQFESFAKRSLWSFIAPEMDPRLRIKKARIWLFAFGFALLALARPQYGTHEETVQVSGLDVVINLDVSNSMAVEDIVPSRLQKAKHIIRSLLDRLEGDRVGVVAFAASSSVACPLTTDLSYVWDTVQILSPKMIQNQGTDLGLGLETARKAIERGGEEQPSMNRTTAPSNIVILITDGEDLEGQAVGVAQKIKESGIKLYILGVGTEKGGPIPVRDEGGNTIGFKRDQTGKAVVSEFHPETLIQLAKVSGGRYWRVTENEAEVEEVAREMGTLNRGDFTERRYRVYEEKFQIPLFIALALLVWELSVPARKMNSGLKSGVVLCLILFLSTFSSSLAHATDSFKTSTPLESYLENKKGIRAFEEGKIDEAKKSFGAAQARDPTRPELEFNQGLVQMQQGENDRAIESFENSARFSETRGDKELLGKSKYNLGYAFAKKGDAKNAIRSYADAIEAAHEAKDPTLEAEARKNLQLVLQEVKKNQQEKQKENQKKEQEKQQQEKQQKNANESEKENEKENKKEKESKSDPKSGDQQEATRKDSKEGKGDEDKTFQNPHPHSFESKKMTQEDVNRVMSELTSKEKQLQEKLHTQHGKNQNNPKDW